MLELQLAGLLEGTSDAAFAVDLQGEVRTWNKGAENLFGYAASEAIGKQCAELIGGRISDGTPVCYESCDILACVRSGREISNYDMEITSRSGQAVWVNVSMLIVSNEHTERRLAVHFMRDIRERKKAEQLTVKVLKLAKDLVNVAEDQTALPPVSPLTAQERNILLRLASGKTAKEVTGELGIGVSTLRNHIYHINQKLHTASRTEAVVQALRRGLI